MESKNESSGVVMVIKILFVNPYFPLWVPGGAEHSLEQMCHQYVRVGRDVQMLAACFVEPPNG